VVRRSKALSRQISKPISKQPLAILCSASLILSILACGPCAGALDEKAGFTTEGEWSIVVGAKATISAFSSTSNDPREPIDVQTASSTNTEVMAVNSISENDVEIEGLAVGSSLLELSIFDPLDASARTFSETITVIEPERMHLYRCIAAERAAVDFPQIVFARGHDALVQFHFTDSSGTYARGRGVYPVTVTPPEAGSLDAQSSDERELAIRTPESPAGPFSVSTTLAPEPVHDDAAIRDLRTIDAGQITSVNITNQASIQRGFDQKIEVEIRAGDDIVCSRLPMKFESKTPNVCNFRAADGSSTPLIENTKTVPRINPQAIGTCQIVITIVAVGVAIASTIDLDVFEPAPPSMGGSSGGGGSDYDFD